jgi:hypothetical protein
MVRKGRGRLDRASALTQTGFSRDNALRAKRGAKERCGARSYPLGAFHSGVAANQRLQSQRSPVALRMAIIQSRWARKCSRDALLAAGHSALPFASHRQQKPQLTARLLGGHVRGVRRKGSTLSCRIGSSLAASTPALCAHPARPHTDPLVCLVALTDAP